MIAMPVVKAVLLTLEIGVFCLGSFVWLRSRAHPYPIAAALALGIIVGLGLLSLLLQVAFLLGLPELAPLLELVVLGGIIGGQWRQWRRVGDLPQAIKPLWQAYPGVIAVLSASLTYLFLQALLLPPSSWDALVYHLPRVLLWEQNRSLFLREFTIPQQAVFPVGSDILFHLFLRWQTDYGLGLFSWLAYLVILVGTYALVRPRVSPAIALTTAIILASLPEIVYQATGTKNDILLAAAALGCVIWADRWRQYPTIEPIFGLWLTVCFGIAIKTSFVLFAGFFGLLWLSLVMQRGQGLLLVRLLIHHWARVAGVLLPALVLSQVWLFWDNHHQFGHWLGPTDFAFINQNNDGLFGAIANLIRYSLQSIHLLRPVDQLWASLWGWSLTGALQTFYDSLLAPLLGKAGFAEIAKDQSFEIVWEPREYVSWFGPMGIFLIVPAVFWCVFKEKGLPRVMGLVTILLVLAISYKIGWSPWKSRFFTLVFTCSGLCVAMFLKHLNPNQWWLSSLRWLSVAILLYASLYNYTKPMIPASSFYLGRENIWVASDWTRDRLIYDHLARGQQTEYVSQALSTAQRVAIVGYDHYFSLMFYNPDLEFVLLSTANDADGRHVLTAVQAPLATVDHLVCFGAQCSPEALDAIRLDLRWNNNGDFGGIPEVYRVFPTQATERHP
jgi:hypothetical protein